MSPRHEERLLAQLERIRIPLRLGYLATVLLATMSSFRLDADPAAVQERLSRMFAPGFSGRDAIDGVRNVALFAGWGLLWMVTAAPDRSWTSLRNAVLSGAGLSLIVESAQLLSSSRRASVLDLVTNTAGAVVGAVTLVVLVLSLAQRRGAKSFVGIPAALFTVAAGAAAAGEALVPLFRQQMRIPVSGSVLNRLSGSLETAVWVPWEGVPFLDLLLFLPVGVFCVAWGAEMGVSYRRSALWCAVLGTVGALLLELAHGVMGIEVRMGAVLAHGLAVSGGAVLGAVGIPAFSRAARGRRRIRLFSIMYAAWLVLWLLRPFVPDVAPGRILARLSTPWWIPLRSLGMRVDVFSVVDVGVGFFLFLPLGALLAVWPVRARGRLSGLWPVIYLACALEACQLLVVQRTLDITDPLIQAAGALVGWLVVRRAGYPVYGSLYGR